VLGSAAVALAGLLPSAGADSAAARVVDSTFACAVKLRAGARIIEPSAWSGFSDPARKAQWKWLPYADVGGRDLIAYVFMYAGAPPPVPEIGASSINRWLGVDAASCKPSQARIRLGTVGLEGGLASQLQYSDEYECPSPSSVLVRLRAEFRTPVTLRIQRLYQGRWFTTSTKAPVRQGAFAVATLTGKPLAYATVSESGKARLFTARSCVPD
jgi:hypothetical protein